MSPNAATAQERSAYVGWYVAGIVLMVTFVAAGVVWFMFHPW